MYKESFQIYIEPLTELPYELAFSLVAYPITWVSTLTGSLLPKISDLRSKYKMISKIGSGVETKEIPFNKTSK